MPLNKSVNVPALPRKLDLQDINKALSDRDDIIRSLFENSPYIELQKLASQPLPTGTTVPTRVVWDRLIISRPYDYRTRSNILYMSTDPAGQLTRLYCTINCQLLLTYVVSFNGSTAGTLRKTVVTKNGVDVNGSVLRISQATDPLVIPVMTIVEITAGDYVDITAVQDSGVMMSILGSNNNNTSSLKARVLF